LPFRTLLPGVYKKFKHDENVRKLSKRSLRSATYDEHPILKLLMNAFKISKSSLLFVACFYKTMLDYLNNPQDIAVV
jgi:hypothetical protein